MLSIFVRIDHNELCLNNTFSSLEHSRFINSLCEMLILCFYFGKWVKLYLAFKRKVLRICPTYIKIKENGSSCSI